MHGAKRSEYKHRFADPQVAAGLAQKAQRWNALSAHSLQLKDIAFAASAAAAASNSNDDDTAATFNPDEETDLAADRDRHLQLLDKMLRVNPDPLHLWNHRRSLLFLHNNDTGVQDWLPTELALTQAGLERNPKAYGAWFHRKWILRQVMTATTGAAGAGANTTTDMLSQELGLTELFLQRDERNFHCWNYRRYVVGLELDNASATDGTAAGNYDGAWTAATAEDTAAVVVIGPQLAADQHEQQQSTANNSDSGGDMKPQPNNATFNSTNNIHTILQREWSFTKTKIVQNFSNFSAFHYRGKLLLVVRGSVGDDTKTTSSSSWNPLGETATTATTDADAEEAMPTTVRSIAESEWSLMENIMFTEPDDQTIWWYHRFVLDWVRTHHDINNASSNTDTSNNHDEWYVEWLKKQAETLQVLVDDTNEEEEKGGCKWALLGCHLVLSRLVASVSLLEEESSQQSPSEKEEWESQLDSLLNQLVQVDPDRTQRYETMRR